MNEGIQGQRRVTEWTGRLAGRLVGRICSLAWIPFGVKVVGKPVFDIRQAKKIKIISGKRRRRR
jgi:hypothetical protein